MHENIWFPGHQLGQKVPKFRHQLLISDASVFLKFSEGLSLPPVFHYQNILDLLSLHMA